MSLVGKVAMVTGSSRGAGKGVALALGEAGATVYVTGRTTRSGPKPRDGAPGTIEETAEAVSAKGGHGIPVQCDHTNEEQVMCAPKQHILSRSVHSRQVGAIKSLQWHLCSTE